MDDIKLRNERAKGHETQKLMRQLEPYFDTLRGKLLDAFELAPVRDADGLVGIKYQLKALEGFKGVADDRN